MASFRLVSGDVRSFVALLVDLFPGDESEQVGVGITVRCRSVNRIAGFSLMVIRRSSSVPHVVIFQVYVVANPDSVPTRIRYVPCFVIGLSIPTEKPGPSSYVSWRSFDCLLTTEIETVCESLSSFRKTNFPR